MAANNDGIWSTTDATLSFAVDPAWNQTLLFQSACVVLFLALLFGLYRYRLHQMSQQFNVRLEERVVERTRIARDLHDTLLQSFQGLMLRFQVVNDMLPEGTAKSKLEQSLQRADLAIGEARTAVYELRSSTTIGNDLAEALTAVGEELATSD